MVAREAVIELDMTVDDALKYIISMGVASPDGIGGKNGRVAPPVVRQPKAVNQ